MRLQITIVLFTLFSLITLQKGLAQGLSKFSTYGFFDLEFELNSIGENNVGFFDDANPNPPTFDIHHVNIMTNYQLTDNSRIFVEIEWEHGPEIAASGDTATGDGQVKLERAWYQHRFNKNFRVKAGQFLTPYGFFNLVHDATPTYLFQSLPSVYGKHIVGNSAKKRMFAKIATGIQALGVFDIGESMSASYAIYLVNGNGSQPQSADNNVDKGFGFKLGLSPLEPLEFSVSYYTEDNDFTGAMNRLKTLVAGSKYEGNNLISIFELQNVKLNGSHAIAYYFELGYNLTDIITPMARYEFVDHNTDVDDTEFTIYSFGVNLKLKSNVIIKIEDHAKTLTASGSKTNHKFMTTLAVAF